MAEDEKGRRKGREKAQDPSQNVLFTAGMLRGEQPGHLLDPEDINPYDGYSYGKHNEIIIRNLKSHCGRNSELDGVEVYRRMFCLEEDIPEEFAPKENNRIQYNMEKPVENRDGVDVRTYRSNPVAYARASADDPKSGKFHIVFRDEIETKIRQLQQNSEFVIMSGLSYFGKRPMLKHAGLMYSMVFDLDGVTQETMIPLFAQMELEQLPTPNIFVASGSGLHLIYNLVPVNVSLPGVQSWVKYVKRVLTGMLWTKYTSVIPRAQAQGISQGFRIVGSPSKIRGIRVRAFEARVDRYTLSELESYITPSDEAKVLREGKFQKPPRPFEQERTPLEEAKRRWPEWWTKVEEAQRLGITREKGTWTCRRGLYDWWLQKIREPGAVRVGSRYWTTLCTAVMAVKAGVTYEEVHRDMQEMRTFFDALGAPRFPFTEGDMEDGLKGYYHPHAHNFSIQTISSLSGIHIEKKQHPFLEAYRKQQRKIAEKQGVPYVEEKMTRERWLEVKGRSLAAEAREMYGTDWRKGGGRKSLAPKLNEWLQEHPYAKIADAVSDPSLGISRRTITEHWKECGGLSPAERMEKWFDDHPDATVRMCMEELGVGHATAEKYYYARRRRLLEQAAKDVDGLKSEMPVPVFDTGMTNTDKGSDIDPVPMVPEVYVNNSSSVMTEDEDVAGQGSGNCEIDAGHDPSTDDLPKSPADASAKTKSVHGFSGDGSSFSVDGTSVKSRRKGKNAKNLPSDGFLDLFGDTDGEGGL